MIIRGGGTTMAATETAKWLRTARTARETADLVLGLAWLYAIGGVAGGIALGVHKDRGSCVSDALGGTTCAGDTHPFIWLGVATGAGALFTAVVAALIATFVKFRVDLAHEELATVTSS
jgi:hypothetical protein